MPANILFYGKNLKINIMVISQGKLSMHIAVVAVLNTNNHLSHVRFREMFHSLFGS